MLMNVLVLMLVSSLPVGVWIHLARTNAHAILDLDKTQRLFVLVILAASAILCSARESKRMYG